LTDSERFFIDTEQLNLQHLILTANNPYDPAFATLQEHIYVSKNLNVDLGNLPSGFVPYDSSHHLKGLTTYQEYTNCT
jgi:hypothetical protein